MSSQIQKDDIIQRIKLLQKKAITKEKTPIEKAQQIPPQLTQKNMEDVKKEQIKAQRIERLKQIREQNKKVLSNNNKVQTQSAKDVKQVIKIEHEETPESDEEEHKISDTEQISHDSNKENKKPANKIKDRWNRDCKILLLSQPQLIRDQPLIKNKKYQIQFKYICDGKIREATIRFGSVNGQDYTENLDESIKVKNYRKFGGLSNPLDGNYWRYWICNTEKDILTAYCQYLIQKF